MIQCNLGCLKGLVHAGDMCIIYKKKGLYSKYFINPGLLCRLTYKIYTISTYRRTFVMKTEMEWVKCFSG